MFAWNMFINVSSLSYVYKTLALHHRFNETIRINDLIACDDY